MWCTRSIETFTVLILCQLYYDPKPLEIKLWPYIRSHHQDSSTVQLKLERTVTYGEDTFLEKTKKVRHYHFKCFIQSMGCGRDWCGILNSEVLRGGVERYQAQGQWGARHFDKYVFNLPFPKFDEDDSLHREIADAAKRAEEVARAVPMKEGEYFTRARGRIRDALAGDGAAARLESLVAALLEAADASS